MIFSENIDEEKLAEAALAILSLSSHQQSGVIRPSASTGCVLRTRRLTDTLI
jgi:hypothetical protein